MNNVQLDPVDRAILEHLQADSRLTYAAIGSLVHLSAAAVHNRVKGLERRGVISGYGARVDPAAVGLPVTAFLFLRVSDGLTGLEVRADLAPFPEIEECHGTAGSIDVLVKVRCTSPEHLESLIARIRRVPGVSRTDTTIVLGTSFEGRPLRPPESA